MGLKVLDASSRNKTSDYPHKPYVARNYSRWWTLCRWLYGSIFTRFLTVVSESEAEKSSQTNNENRFLLVTAVPVATAESVY